MSRKFKNVRKIINVSLFQKTLVILQKCWQIIKQITIWKKNCQEINHVLDFEKMIMYTKHICESKKISMKFYKIIKKYSPFLRISIFCPNLKKSLIQKMFRN